MEQKEACVALGVTLRDLSIFHNRIFDAFRQSPAEPTPAEKVQPDVAPVEPVRPPVDSFALSPDEASAEVLLIEQARSNPSAFGVLYERYVDRIYAYIYHRVGNVQEAEDLTARTFYRALDNLESYEDRGAPFAAWLFRIAHNLMANWHRDRSRRRFLSLDRLWGHSAAQTSPEHQVEQAETHEALWSAISRLPEERRNLLLWKFGSQMSNVEIGELMDKSESAIKSLYFRTLAALRQDLEARGWGGGDVTLHEDERGPVIEPTHDAAPGDA
jgi:RNA polymerase sigma-70 factor (ECF subfamily)